MCLSDALKSFPRWLLARIWAAWDTFVVNTIAWIIGILLLLLLSSILAVVGIRHDIIDPPQWWPWKPPPRTAQVHLNPLTLPSGNRGYAFASSAFAEAKRTLDGRGSLELNRPELEMLRVCQDIVFPPQETPDRLIRLIEEKFFPCLKLTSHEEGEYFRYVLSLAEDNETKVVKRQNRGKSELVDQLFCKCDARQIEEFLTHPELP